MADGNLSGTEAFQVRLQEVATDVLGEKISRAKAWDLFKAYTAAVVRHCVELDPLPNGIKKLPLSGIGTFFITWGKARQIPGKESSLVEALKDTGIPRFRWKPSERIRTYVLRAVAGVNPDGTPYEPPEEEE